MARNNIGGFSKPFLVLGLITIGLLLITKPIWKDGILMLLLYNNLFLFTITYLSGVAMVYTLMDNHTRFMFAMAGSTIGKLLLSFIYIALLVYYNEDQAFTIVASFFFFYILFTGFEVFQLFHKLRPHLKKENKSENH